MNIDHKYCASKSCNVYCESELTFPDSRRPGKAYCLRKSESVCRAVEILHHLEGAVGRGAFYTHVPALPVGPEVHCANGPEQFDMVAELQMPLGPLAGGA